MVSKVVPTLEEAVEGVFDGATILVGGFGNTGQPGKALAALAETGVKDLTVICSNSSAGDYAINKLMRAGCVRKFMASFPRDHRFGVFEELLNAGLFELEIVPQGTLAERVRAGGAGVPAFYTRTSYGTPLGEGKEVREFDGVPYVLEHAIKGDFAFVLAEKADPWGNLTYYKTSRNFNPVMAMAGNVTIAQVTEIVGLGELDPEHIITPSIFVDRVVQAVEVMP